MANNESVVRGHAQRDATGRRSAMGGYVALPSDWTARKAKPWIAKAYAAAIALPAKKPKKKAAKG